MQKMNTAHIKRAGLTILMVAVVIGMGAFVARNIYRERAAGVTTPPLAGPARSVPGHATAAHRAVTSEPRLSAPSTLPHAQPAVVTNSAARDFRAESERALAGGDISLLRKLLKEWTQHDPEAALHWVEQVAAGANPKGAVFFQSVSEWVWSLPAGLKLRALRAVGLEWVKEAPLPAMQWITQAGQADFQLAMGVVTAMATQWAKSDPNGLRQWAAQLPEASNRNPLWIAVVDALARMDIGVLGEFIHGLPEGHIKEYAWNRYFFFGVETWASKNPAVTLQWVKDFPEGHARSELIAKVTRIWAAQAPEAALQWVQQLPEGSDRDSAFPEVAALWTEKNPTEAARLAEKNPGSIPAVARAWAAADPEAASRWVQQLPQQVRRSAVNAVASTWAAKDGEAAASWARELQGDGGMALLYVALGWGRSEPVKAMAFAEKELPDGTRHLGLSQVFAAWYRTNSVAATAWLKQSSLPPETKAELAKDPAARPPVIGF